MSPRKHEQCFNFDAEISDIQKCLVEGHRTIILIRGVTGSGKSTLARELVNHSENGVIVKNDVSNNITRSVRKFIDEDKHLIVVDEENVQRSSVKKFAELAVNGHYEIFVLEPDTDWRHDAIECKKRSEKDEEIGSIESKIMQLKENQLGWEHLVIGGEASVKISNFHIDTEITSVLCKSPISSVNKGSLTESTTSSTSSLSQIFSMTPEIKVKSMRSVGTQVDVQCITYGLAGFDSVFKHCGVFSGEEHNVSSIWKGPVRMVERKTETESFEISQYGETVFKPSLQLLVGTSDEIAFSLLRHVFSKMDIIELRHYLQVLGFEKTFNLMYNLGEEFIEGEIPVDERILLDEIEALESFTVSNMTIEEEIEARRVERLALKFVEEMYNPDTENDEQIALLLHSEMNDENGDNDLIEEDYFNIANLEESFPGTNKKVVREAYNIAGRKVDFTREILLSNGEVENTYAVKLKPKPTWSKKVASSPSPLRLSLPKKSKKEEENHFLKKRSGRHSQLEEIQLLAIRTRQKIEADRITSSNSMAAAKYRQLIIVDRASRMKIEKSSEVKELDRKIREAHNNPWFLDLHYMSVDGAVKLVKEAIEAVKYHLKAARNLDRRITVVTGSGNNSKCGAKIKPQVLAMLQHNDYNYELVNDGCIRFKV